MRHEGSKYPGDDQQTLIIAQYQIEDDEEPRRRQHQKANHDRRPDRDQALAQHISVDDGQSALASSQEMFPKNLKKHDRSKKPSPSSSAQSRAG